MTVRRTHHAAADIQRRADNAIGPKPIQREHCADDVDNRVERTDLVEVDRVDWHLMDGRFGLTQPMKQFLRPSPRRGRQRRAFNQVVDLGETAVVMMRGRIGDRRSAIVDRRYVADDGRGRWAMDDECECWWSCTSWCPR